ncbi:hypothetical protein ACLB2K_028728 [Fragaria x ananassa]
MPVFDNLSDLTLLRDGQWWKILMKFLERSPNLESFVINHDSCQPGCYFPGQKELYIELLDCRNPDHVEEVLDWTPPESVQTVSIKGFEGKEIFGYPEEMESIKYLLKNCLLLENMTVYIPGLRYGTQEEFYNEISEFEWGSRTVQIVVISVQSLVIDLLRVKHVKGCKRVAYNNMLVFSYMNNLPWNLSTHVKFLRCMIDYWNSFRVAAASDSLI